MAEPNPRSAPSAPRPRATPPGRRAPGRGVRPETRGPAAPLTPPAAETVQRRRWRDIPASLRWIGAVVVLLIAAVAIFVSAFQWNWLREPIDGYASGGLQRQVVIHGDLKGHMWSWTPSLTARDVTVSQPAWAGKGQMAALPSLTLSLDLKALLGGRFVLTSVDAERPSFTLLRDATGRQNWTFGAPTTHPVRRPGKLNAFESPAVHKMRS